MAKPSQETNGKQLRKQLLVVNLDLADLELELDRVNLQIGAANARHSRGDKKAASDLGELTLKRSGLENDVRDVRLTKSALEAEVATWEDEQTERQCQDRRDEFAKLTSDARAAETRLADLARQAAEAAAELQSLRQTWVDMCNKLLQDGVISRDDRPHTPRNPTQLVKPQLVKGGSGYVDNWMATSQRFRPSLNPPILKRVSGRSNDDVRHIGQMNGWYGEMTTSKNR